MQFLIETFVLASLCIGAGYAGIMLCDSVERRAAASRVQIARDMVAEKKRWQRRRNAARLRALRHARAEALA